jgi:hypothetical protein
VPFITAVQTDGQPIEFDDQPLNSGGEKIVFRTRDRSQVVAFFYGQLRDRLERADRLTRILTKYNPTVGTNGAYWLPYFCWPVGVIDGDRRVPADFVRRHGLVYPVLGVVTPAYREPFYFRDTFGNRQEKEVRWFTGRKASAFVPPAEKGSFLTRLQICTRLARAVRRLHFAGLAHSDLSNKNVLIDPRGGDACVIDIDSLVVPGVAPPSVLGTPGYIAPEVVAGRAQPSIDTDKHALAVLVYEILLQRHPLAGQRVHSTRSPEADEALSMGARAIWVEHPSDRSNPPVLPIRVPVARLGPFLEALCRKAFVDGLHRPALRPDAAEWESALYRTLHTLHPSPARGEWFPTGPGLSTRCPFTGERVQRAVPVARFLRPTSSGLADERGWLTVFHHLVLHDWHRLAGVAPDENADRTPRGYFSLHDGRWWLVNLSPDPMEVLEPAAADASAAPGALDAGDGGAGTRIAQNGAVEVLPGRRVRLGPSPDARVFQFDFLRA